MQFFVGPLHETKQFFYFSRANQTFQATAVKKGLISGSVTIGNID